MSVATHQTSPLRPTSASTLTHILIPLSPGGWMITTKRCRGRPLCSLRFPSDHRLLFTGIVSSDNVKTSCHPSKTCPSVQQTYAIYVSLIIATMWASQVWPRRCYFFEVGRPLTSWTEVSFGTKTGLVLGTLYIHTYIHTYIKDDSISRHYSITLIINLRIRFLSYYRYPRI